MASLIHNSYFVIRKLASIGQTVLLFVFRKDHTPLTPSSFKHLTNNEQKQNKGTNYEFT